jgi:3-hydroxy-9,10-secoandrosta-1,3,5(10)-triene-9,17-dione monooxygenase reductase component
MSERDIELGTTEFREVMGHFCTGIVIITAQVDGKPMGLTCQSFVSVSLNPPLISFCPGHSSTSWPTMREAGAFCVNVLAADQQLLSQRFSKSGGDKFKDVAWTTSAFGNPRIDGCLAHVDCTIEAIYEAGDHDIVVGRVQDLVVSRSSTPLLFFQGQFESLSK